MNNPSYAVLLSLSVFITSPLFHSLLPLKRSPVCFLTLVTLYSPLLRLSFTHSFSFFLPTQLPLSLLLLSQALHHVTSPRGTAMKEGICSSSQDESDKETALLLRLNILPEQEILVDEIMTIKTSSGE